LTGIVCCNIHIGGFRVTLAPPPNKRVATVAGSVCGMLAGMLTGMLAGMLAGRWKFIPAKVDSPKEHQLPAGTEAKC
jgi:hypothetical protein